MGGCIGFCFMSSYIYLGDGGTDRREIFHDGTYLSRAGFLPFGEVPQGVQKIRNFGPKFWG